MSVIERLTYLFTKFPGIGQRQAKRFVYFLISQNADFIEDLKNELSVLKGSIKNCKDCFKFFWEKGVQKDICSVCANSERKGSLMVVENDVDLENVEKSGVFFGKYFVLGGVVPILEKNPREKVRVDKLISRVKDLAEKEDLKEIVLAMDFNPEGDNTTNYIKKELYPLSEKYNLKISLLGRGLSLGTELEYSDPETIKNAFENRH